MTPHSPVIAEECVRRIVAAYKADPHVLFVVMAYDVGKEGVLRTVRVTGAVYNDPLSRNQPLHLLRQVADELGEPLHLPPRRMRNMQIVLGPVAWGQQQTLFTDDKSTSRVRVVPRAECKLVALAELMGTVQCSKERCAPGHKVPIFHSIVAIVPTAVFSREPRESQSYGRVMREGERLVFSADGRLARMPGPEEAPPPAASTIAGVRPPPAARSSASVRRRVAAGQSASSAALRPPPQPPSPPFTLRASAASATSATSAASASFAATAIPVPLKSSAISAEGSWLDAGASDGLLPGQQRKLEYPVRLAVHELLGGAINQSACAGAIAGGASPPSLQLESAGSKRSRVTVPLATEGGITKFDVPYSEHSSQQELSDCVCTLLPRVLVPTVFFNPQQRAQMYAELTSLQQACAESRGAAGKAPTGKF